MDDRFLLDVPQVSLTLEDKNNFIKLYYKLYPDNSPDLIPRWKVTSIPETELTFCNNFLSTLNSFCNSLNLEIQSFNFQVMWAGESQQLFIHKDSVGQEIIPARLSWHLIGPILPLKWYKELDGDPGHYISNGSYGAWTIRDTNRFEREAKILEITPCYPCLLNTHEWHTIAQDNIVDAGLRVILSVAFKQDEQLSNKDLWISIKNKLGQ